MCESAPRLDSATSDTRAPSRVQQGCASASTQRLGVVRDVSRTPIRKFECQCQSNPSSGRGLGMPKRADQSSPKHTSHTRPQRQRHPTVPTELFSALFLVQIANYFFFSPTSSIYAPHIQHILNTALEHVLLTRFPQLIPFSISNVYFSLTVIAKPVCNLANRLHWPVIRSCLRFIPLFSHTSGLFPAVLQHALHLHSCFSLAHDLHVVAYFRASSTFMKETAYLIQ